MTRLLLLIATLAAFALAGCDSLPGKPHPGPEVPRPDDVLDFAVLYKENCSACHGAEGKGGAAIALNNPVYLGLVDDATLRRVTAQGIRGTAMPGFAESAGGMLTDKQVDAIVREMRARWARPDALHGGAPPYAASLKGDAQHGAEAYKSYCSSCHGADGKGGKAAGSIVDGSYLALISDQGLRTVVITGRPELGAPDWRGNTPGHPMSDQEITDVVAWLTAQRSERPGQPYPTPAAKAPASGGTR